jgi:hypothetical protein
MSARRLLVHHFSGRKNDARPDLPSTERQTRQRHPKYPRPQALRRHHLRHELSRGVPPESRDEVAGEDERKVIMRRQIDTKFLSLYRLVRRVSG